MKLILQALCPLLPIIDDNGSPRIYTGHTVNILFHAPGKIPVFCIIVPWYMIALDMGSHLPWGLIGLSTQINSVAICICSRVVIRVLIRPTRGKKKLGRDIWGQAVVYIWREILASSIWRRRGDILSFRRQRGEKYPTNKVAVWTPYQYRSLSLGQGPQGHDYRFGSSSFSLLFAYYGIYQV